MFRFLSICISYPSTFISSPISDSTWLCSVHELGSLLTWTSKLQCKFESYQVNSPHSNWLRGKKKQTTQYHCYPIESSSLNKQYLGGADFCSFALLSLLSRHPSLPPQLNTNHSVIVIPILTQCLFSKHSLWCLYCMWKYFHVERPLGFLFLKPTFTQLLYLRWEPCRRCRLQQLSMKLV